MIKKVWNSYINWLLKYLDTDNGINQWRLTSAHLMFILFVFFICLIVFYLLLGSENILGIFIVSIGYGRLIFDRILNIYDKNHPYDKRYTPFLRFLALSTVAFVTIGYTFVLIKDAQNNTDVQKLIEEKYNTKIEQNEIIKEDKKIVIPLNINPKNEELKLK
jgi:Tfp pilus assembly protein PilO